MRKVYASECFILEASGVVTQPVKQAPAPPKSAAPAAIAQPKSMKWNDLSPLLNVVGVGSGVLSGAAMLGAGPVIQGAVKKFKYWGADCDSIKDPNDRDECDIRTISTEIAKLRKEMLKCERTPNPEICSQRYTDRISTLEQKSNQITQNMAMRKQATG